MVSMPVSVALITIVVNELLIIPLTTLYSEISFLLDIVGLEERIRFTRLRYCIYG